MKNKIVLILLLIMGSVKLQAQENLMQDIHIMPWPQEIKTNTGDFIIDEDFSVFIHGGI